ncbi:3D domain-containing protein [Alteribacillus iranensis]|uniref:3D (Asp-Asp-Asp) domain-containing protein n=1 Tax=Alteribacillus iranensis TaxID=930128 RepID=A0A1I2DS10_9BACI|nr:3D domain-containing protein [Alteribacillus iranensis]SFE83434.1 3D (Asp-Asp-Asp) domain-containing protein [Alteribacillus iranensis]
MKKFFTAAATAVILFVGTSIGSAAASDTYTVKNGDTLYQIAANHNLTVGELKNVNSLSSNLIYPNQTLKVSTSESASSDKKAEQDVKSSTSSYKVKSGDTLYRIAVNHGISVGQLKSWNNLSSNTIYPGQSLKVTGKGSTSATSASQSSSKSATQKAAREMTVTSTAYTANCSGCSGITATGINLKANPNQKVIAVDPNVIPLGTKVHVEGYGTAIAGDTGGAIRGNKIDVFFPSRSDALNWGNRQVKIKILN